MANSNENTQNPKENQEKIADEGIQEHSEHTAENKQPESKDNAQKKNESTCLCKFFKKITEWMCASENKNSNKADENAAENNDAAKQEEMKQADTVEQPKEQRKLSDYLEIISKLLGLATTLGVFIGGFIIYSYLNNINQSSIFPDIITNPYVFIAATIVFGTILLFFLILVRIFYFIGVKLYDISLVCISKILSIIFIIEVIILILLFYFLYNKNYNDYIIILNNSSFIITTCVVFLLLGLGRNQNETEKKITKSHYIYYVCLLIAPIVAIFLFLNYKTIIFTSIHFVRFIEYPENSSWYLLHNNFQQNNDFQETNGINKSDLKKLKKYFTKPKQCSKLELRENALYGYMAWNLGDTKVFCPRSLDNKIRYANNPIPDNCIVISGKALQIMPESYISTNTDGIDDNNPDNTSHDDPAIDIDTDVRFKNDFNAQSNAGLNNFNVQPILPIQSNAKNMSIQIHYGSCNHDSPRNKDGHPDIGYTDKKICQ